MSSAVKGMLIRTPSDVCNQKVVILKGKNKYVDQKFFFDLVRDNRLLSQGVGWCRRVVAQSRYQQRRSTVKGITSPKPKKGGDHEQRAQAILSPVSDPSAPTTNKVLNYLRPKVVVWRLKKNVILNGQPRM